MDLPKHKLEYAAPQGRSPSGERNIVPVTFGAAFGYVAALIAHEVVRSVFRFDLTFLFFPYTESARLYLGESMRIYGNPLSFLAASHFIVYGSALLVANSPLRMIGWIVIGHGGAVTVYLVLSTLIG